MLLACPMFLFFVVVFFFVVVVVVVAVVVVAVAVVGPCHLTRQIIDERSLAIRQLVKESLYPSKLQKLENPSVQVILIETQVKNNMLSQRNQIILATPSSNICIFHQF